MNRFKYLIYPSKIKVKKFIVSARYFFNPNRDNMLKIIYLSNLERARLKKLKRAARLLNRKITNQQLQYIYESYMRQKRFSEAIKTLSLMR